MLSEYNGINKIIWWHTFESIVYHGILLIHQSILFAIAPSYLYGLIGALFSTIYLFVTIINAGLDDSLSSLFGLHKKSKQFFCKFITIQLLINYSVGILILIFIYTFWYEKIFSANIPVIIAIAFLESIKKTAKMVLKLTFQLGIAIYGDLCMLISYIFLVWLGYAYGYPISLCLIFLPLLLTVLFETIFFLCYIYRWYQTLLSNQCKKTESIYYKNIIKNRIYAFTNSIHHIFFSGNFIVLLSAHLVGLDYAGIVKFASSIALNITIIVKKIFGTSSNLVLSTIKNKDIKIKKAFFSLVTNKMYNILFALGIFFIINHKFLLQGNLIQSKVIYLSFLIIFIENLFITYEKFYIMQDRIDYMIAINVLAVLFLYGFCLYLPHSILTAIFFIRLITFIITSGLSFFLWQLKPILSIFPSYFIGSLAISFIFWLAYH